MDAARDPEYLKATARAVADFKSSLEEFLSLHVTNQHFARGLAPAELPRDDADPIEIKELRSKVALAAGRATYAPGLTNAYIHVEGHGKIDPIAAWSSMTSPSPCWKRTTSWRCATRSWDAWRPWRSRPRRRPRRSQAWNTCIPWSGAPLRVCGAMSTTGSPLPPPRRPS